MGQKKKKKAKAGEWNFEVLPDDRDKSPEPYEHRRLIVEFNGVLTELIEERAMTEHLSERVEMLSRDNGYKNNDIEHWKQKLDSERFDHKTTLSELNEAKWKFWFAVGAFTVLSLIIFAAGYQSAGSDPTPPVKESSHE